MKIGTFYWFYRNKKNYERVLLTTVHQQITQLHETEIPFHEIWYTNYKEGTHNLPGLDHK